MSIPLATRNFTEKIRLLWHDHHLRVIVGILLVMAIGASLAVLQQVKTERAILLAQQQLGDIQHKNLMAVAKDLEALVGKIAADKAEGVDTTTIDPQIPIIKAVLFHDQDPDKAAGLIKEVAATLETLRNQKLEADRLAADAVANQGTLNGKVSEGDTALNGVKISLLAGDTTVVSSSSGADGAYSLTTTAGSYTLVASKSGYAAYRKYNVVLVARGTVTIGISLVKAVSTGSSGTSGGSSTAHSSYQRKTITTANGSFLVDLITLDLSSGAIRVVTDTANDSDCADNCPTKSLSSFVGGSGGFAGINGTYFCPPDYASCAGQVGSFFWKVRNTRLAKTINQNNGLGENEPYLTFSSTGKPTYYSQWVNAPIGVYAGINCGPRLIEGGINVLTNSSMDDKQRTVKSNRGALGIKGQTLYAVVAKSATVPDMTSILISLGVDSALNLDGGGSSALYYNGAYKVGPGRSLPNAVIFAGG